MSLSLEGEGTCPKGIYLKTHGAILGEDLVFLGEYEIGIEDFLEAARYVLTNTDLYIGDPRIKFVNSVKSLERVEGFNKGHQRFS